MTVTTVVINIDGRDAVPLRALPYMTGWAEAPDSIVRALCLEPTVRVEGVIQQMAGRRVDIPNRQALRGYQMSAKGAWTAISHRQWGAVAIELSCLTKQLQADERQGADGENHARWRTTATLTLPDHAFVWLDEFESWFSRTRPLAVPSDADVDRWRSEQAQLYQGEDLALVLEEGMADFARPGDLDFTVVFPAELKGNIWRYQSAQEPAACATTVDKSRGGRPPALTRKATVLAALMGEFENAGASWADPLKLPGSANNLHDALKRIEKSVTGKTSVFQVTPRTFQSWVAAAGFGFEVGRTRADERCYWTRLAPQITRKTSAEVFCTI